MTEPLPPNDDLDLAMQLPASIQDPRYVALYNTLIARMMRESAHLNNSTLVTLLIERIAFNYVVMRWKESRPMGELEGFAHATAQKEFNSFWLGLSKELGAMLKQTDREYRDELLRQVMASLQAALESEPSDVSSRVRSRLASKLEQAGF